MCPACGSQPAAESVPPRVLIVDDAQDDREMYALFLSTVGGCQVTQAATGRDALHALALDRPDVMVLDMRLPDLDGADFCQQFRDTPGSDLTTVVAVTALPPQTAEIDRLIEAGPDAVLFKPCSPDTLLQQIRALTAHARVLREHGRVERERAARLRTRSAHLLRQSAEAHHAARALLRTAEHLTLTQRAKANYLDLPELSLTTRQAQRLWGFDQAICRRVLEGLASEGFLVHMRDGRYARRSKL